MSNSSKQKEAEQRAKAAEAETRAAQAKAEEARVQAAVQAKQDVKITPQAQYALDRAGNRLKAFDQGDYSRLPGVASYMHELSNAKSAAMRASPTGSAALAFDVANPNLLAMNQQRIDAESANAQAAGVDQIARETERSAVQDVANFSGMDLSAKTGAVNFMFQNAGLAQNNAGLNNSIAEQAWSNYGREREHKGFLQSLALGAVGAGGQVAASYFGKKS
jgi:hypothetical protein